MGKLKFAVLWLLTIGFLASVSCLMMSSGNDRAGWIFAVIYSAIGVYYATKELLSNRND